jgi:hypothetical protein
MIIKGTFLQRLRASISFAWSIYMEKVGSGLLQINKEASMQLQYSYILNQILPLICFSDSEKVQIELETGVSVSGRMREIDILLKGTDEESVFNIAVELKCYREIAASGGKRGATDIFMKDVYEDLQLLESYCNQGISDYGVSLIMNDLDRLVNPKNKSAKCWDYDISNKTQVSPTHLTTPIGGKDINITINKNYTFNWIQKGKFWFTELEGF